MMDGWMVLEERRGRRKSEGPESSAQVRNTPYAASADGMGWGHDWPPFRYMTKQPDYT